MDDASIHLWVSDRYDRRHVLCPELSGLFFFFPKKGVHAGLIVVGYDASMARLQAPNVRTWALDRWATLQEMERQRRIDQDIRDRENKKKDG